MTETSMQWCPQRVAVADLQVFPHGAVVKGEHVSALVALNPTALAIWELCDGSTTVQEMVHAVCDLFGLQTGEAARDVERALDRMRAVGVVA